MNVSDSVTYLEASIKEYGRFNKYGSLVSATLFLHIVTKLLFNMFAQVKMPYDKWTIIDAVSAIMNLVCFNVIGGITPEVIMDPKRKKTIDYYVIFVVLLSWTRFFSYFLVVKPISKLLMITYRIVMNTMSFNLIVIAFMLLVMSVDMTFFQDIDIEFYELFTSFRTMFDGMIAVFYYGKQPRRGNLFEAMVVLEVSITNILLANFLVTIL